MPENDELRTDVYQDHPTPDAPVQGPGRLDSGVDQSILITTLADLMEEV